jgi:transposase InsO family protein
MKAHTTGKGCNQPSSGTGMSSIWATDQPLAQQRASDYLDYYYHNKRPHLALDMMTPTQFAESHLC